jgi:hypothetical protein
LIGIAALAKEGADDPQVYMESTLTPSDEGIRFQYREDFTGRQIVVDIQFSASQHFG